MSNAPIKKCPKCQELRGLKLHLYELALFCDLLDNKNTAIRRARDHSEEERDARSTTIAKWLKLASHLESVTLNPYRFQIADQYCEPVADMLKSYADHHESIVTPLTQFLYVANALEETYRFCSWVYEDLRSKNQNIKNLHSFSMQSVCILDLLSSRIAIPKHYDHLVDSYRKIIQCYLAEFPAQFNASLDGTAKLSYGLDLVIGMRNNIAHGLFPIIDDPEYVWEPNAKFTKQNLVIILRRSSRISAINIQMLISIANHGFQSYEYDYLCDDSDRGGAFKENCTLAYLQSLHMAQPFGLNEESLFAFHAGE